MYAQVQNLIAKNEGSEGVKALKVLMYHPNTDIYCINLTHMIDPPDYSSLNELLSSELSPETNPFGAISKIPMTDNQAIREVSKRMNQLICQKAEIIGFDPNATSVAIDTEISALKKYLSECQRPGGIRNCNNDERKASQRISVAIKRLLQRNAEQHPEAVAYLTKHLKMGLYFQYLED